MSEQTGEQTAEETVSMTNESEAGRLGIVLEHWMEHNRGHMRDFAKWAEKAEASGHARVSERIREAAEQMRRANDVLQDALAELGGS